MSIFTHSLAFAAGGALIWFCKSAIQQMVIGANALSAKLHAQARTIETKAATIKSAL